MKRESEKKLSYLGGLKEGMCVVPQSRALKSLVGLYLYAVCTVTIKLDGVPMFWKTVLVGNNLKETRN